MEFLIGLGLLVGIGALVRSKGQKRPANGRTSAMTKWFRETNTGDQYQLEFEWEDGHYVIYCHTHPDNPYSDSVADCHLYSDGRVCVAAGREPRTVDKAVAIASVWATGYSQYVRTGRFGRTGGRVSV